MIQNGINNMELNIIKQIKALRNLIRHKPKSIVEKPKAETVIKAKKEKPVKEPRHKVEDTIVHINCNPMTLKEISEKYGLEVKTVQARYKAGNRGRLLIRPSNRKQKQVTPT